MEKEPSKKNAERVVLSAQSTAQLFDGNLILSLVGLSYEGSPLRHKVIATAGVAGKKNVQMDLVDVGYSVNYEGYEIRVIASSTFSATFLVTKLKDQP